MVKWLGSWMVEWLGVRVELFETTSTENKRPLNRQLVTRNW
jgi:hypothetical protein